MKIHEYQARELLKAAGVPVARAILATTPDEAAAAARELGGKVAVKAQVHAGGRGKAGGVKLAGSADEARSAASKILGMDIKGSKVRKVLVMEQVDISRELYLGLVFDRENRGCTLIASSAGGVDIEEVAEKTPEKIFKSYIHPLGGLSGYQARGAAYAMGLTGKTAQGASQAIQAMYSVYVSTDASLLEINPFVVRGDGSTIAIDSKMNFDDNALYRQKEVAALRDLGEEDPLEVEAKEADLAFVHLGGEVGIIGNGAGLVMTTLDVVNAAGAKPANFLDIGGSSSPEKVKRALEIVLREPGLKVIFINVFGGITRCDDVANGMVSVMKSIQVPVPVVIRMTGTNVELGRKILKDSGLNLETFNTMEEAAARAAAIVKGASRR